MNSATLKLEKRNEVGGGKARRLLEHGLIPAVIYGRDMPSTAIFVNGSELRKFLKTNGRNTVFNAEFAEEHDLSILIKNIQYNPLSQEIIHLDLQRLSPDERVQVNIPVRVKGVENMKNSGNVVVQQLKSITVESLPRDIPQHADVEISELQPGHCFTAGDFKFPSGVTLISKPNKVVLTLKSQHHDAALDT